MKRIISLIFLSLLGISLGQGGGFQTVGTMLWNDGYNIDTMDTTIIAIPVDDYVQSFVHLDSQLPPTTQAPQLGAGSTQSPKAEGEGESLSQQVMYKGDSFVLEHHGFSIECNLTLFDQLKWTHNDSSVVLGKRGYSVTNMPSPQGFSGSRLTVANSQTCHAGKYKCSSTRQRFHTVYILRDSTTTHPVKIISIGRELYLPCNMSSIEGSPLPHLDWYKNDTKLDASNRVMLNQSNSSMTIAKAKADDEGVYRCVVVNDTLVDKLQPQIFRVIWLELKPMPKSSSITVQEQLVLECPVKGKPEPTIIWKKDDRPISEVFNETRAKIEPNTNGIQNGKLLISNAESGDRGNYTCTITIFSKTYTKFTFIRVKDKYAALWPFLGIVVEVLVLGIIIFIFEKRRAKAEFEESDTDQGNDQKNTAEHNKDAVRQRK